jgi:four helix bundle protein
VDRKQNAVAAATNPKSETRNPKQIQMSQGERPKREKSKQYDLEDRTQVFAKRVRAFFKRLPRIDANIIDGRQLIRASGSVGANYIESNESLSRKDFVMRIKISRKEAKECRWFLGLLDTCGDGALERTREELVQEATELTSIFGAILRNSE